MGLETRACINGLNKTDFENVKKIPTLETETDEIKNETIPSLDDRITALEQGGGGNDYSWSEFVTFKKFSELEEVINEYFEYDEYNETYILKYDTVVKYIGFTKFVPKGFDYFELSFFGNTIDNPTSSDLRINAVRFNAQQFFFMQPQDDTKCFINEYKWTISNPSDATFTFVDYSQEMSREFIYFRFKNITR